MLIAAELALLAIQPDGSLVRAGAILERVSAGITGAVITELADRGHVEVDDQTRVTVTGTPTTDELLARELEVLRHHDGERLTTAYVDVPHVGWSDVIDRHLQLGRLRREKRFLRQATFPLTDPEAHQALVDGVRAAAHGVRPLDRRLTVLLALIGPSWLIEVVAPTRQEWARVRMAEAAAQVQLSFAVEALAESRSFSRVGVPLAGGNPDPPG